MIDPSFRAVFSAGNGEVEMYEMFITDKWHGMAVSELLSGCDGIVCAALTRAGRAELPSPSAKLQKDDVLTVSATLDGVRAIRAKLQEGKEV
jgi:trk system potassium uptake protein TrkA